MENKKWTLYCHIVKDGRKYIGITSNNVKRRWNNGRGYLSNKYFMSYIKKYGWQNIKHIILYENLTETEAKEKEKYLIKKFNTQDKKFGFNLTAGGDSGFSPNDETRRKMSVARKKRVTTEETKRKISESVRGIKNGFYGKHHTAETKRKLSAAAVNRTGYFKGKKLSEEHKKKIGLKSLYRNSKPIKCVELNKIYKSARDASEDLNFKFDSSISSCCNGKRKTAHGYTWNYV